MIIANKTEKKKDLPINKGHPVLGKYRNGEPSQRRTVATANRS